MSKYAQVQKQQKTLPYTIEPIGDATALKYWKEYRLVLEAERRTAKEPERRSAYERACLMVKDQATNPFKLNANDKAEIAFRQKRLAQLRGDAEAARTRLESAIQKESEPVAYSWDPSGPPGTKGPKGFIKSLKSDAALCDRLLTEIPAPTLLQKIKQFFNF